MAKAIKQARKVREVVEQEEAVILTLTPEEAQWLADVTMNIGGPGDSRRKFADATRGALWKAGVVGRLNLPDICRDRRAIYFTN